MTELKEHLNIIYIYPGSKSTFVAKDIRLLSQFYAVSEYSFNTSNKKLILWELFKQQIFILGKIFSSSIFIIKFGGYWSLIPIIFARLFDKKTIIITGGTDCVSFPSIAYGNFQNKTLAWFTKKSFQWTNHIIALHPSMMYSDYTFDNCTFKHQGLKAHIPNVSSPYSIAHNGYDSNFWKKTKEVKQGTFLTVASGLGEERRKKLKGIDTILHIAEHFPNHQFIIVGTIENEIPEHPENVLLKPKASANELLNHYSQAEFYLQLSMSEGFPNSLCEAMLCECVPIVSHVASMPFIVADSGFILERKDLNMLKNLIQQALDSNTEEIGKKARKRIADNFTEEKRAKDLIEAVESVLSN